MENYQQYLSEQILAEDKVITYRVLSRSLKVNVNTAKQMLYEFHKTQNKTRPGAVRATYLVYGMRTQDEAKAPVQPDGDVEMSSSLPDVDVAADIVPVYNLAILRDEQLEDELGKYSHVSAIHVYSLGPRPMNDPVMLYTAGRQLQELQYAAGTAGAQQPRGVIVNAEVRMRERRGASAKVAAALENPAPPEASKPAATAAKADRKQKPSAVDLFKQSSKRDAPLPSSAPEAAKKPVPSLKRGGSSGIMQSFARAAAKPKKATASQNTASSREDQEEATKALSDDGEDDSEELSKPRAPAANGGTKSKSKKEREEELRRMMDDDDEEEEEENNDESDAKADSPAEEPAGEPMDEPANEPVTERPENVEPAEVISTSSGDGRRRGKRKIMRKKQIMDDQGYLVTIQEQGWESFSEDEPAPTSSKPKATAPATNAPAGKSKQSSGPGAPKGSQGNIMSFFAKK